MRFTFRWPRPAHGWDAFFTEMVVVVVGVLLALWAQQLVESWRSQGTVADVRQALNAELSQSFEAYRARIEQGACARRRLSELEQWLTGQERGMPTRLVSPIDRPLGFSLDRTAWGQAEAAVAQMPLKERIAYGVIYSDLDNYDGLRRQEKQVWLAIRGYEGAGVVSAERQFELRSLITQARDIDRSITLNWDGMPEDYAERGVTPASVRYSSEAWRGLCLPLQTRAP